MNVHDDLTVLLTLKDRVPFTSRWMNYANATCFPFKVLIADGGSDEGASALLADRKKYPNLNYDYVRYPPDRSYPDYYAKIADALGRVSTPYVVMADNDDFFCVDALREAIRFLSDHPDHVSCGGQGAIFWLGESQSTAEDGQLYGNKIRWKCTRETRSIESDSIIDRIRGQSLSLSDPIFYYVKRIAVARMQFEVVRKLELKDLFLMEILTAFLLAVAGKTRRLESLYVVRQHNAPGSSGAVHEQRNGDWLGRMLVDSWSSDFSKFATAISVPLAEAEGISTVKARQAVIDAYRMHVAHSLLSNILSEPTITTSMPAMVVAVRRLVALPEGSWLRNIARFVYRRTRWLSLDSVYGTEILATPVPNARRDIKPIVRFLAKGN